MKILCVGDVVGAPGLAFLARQLPQLKQQTGADFVVVNGENADKSGVGLDRAAAEEILRYADVVTGGNHSLRRASREMYAEMETVLCPANLPFGEEAEGCCMVDTGRQGSVKVISLLGLAFMEPMDSPFKRAEELLAKHPAKYTVVDFHAESTAEKKALAFFLDGRVSAVFGSHTHVQTADEQILPGGTGYITDVGMCGPQTSVIGVRPQDAVKKQREHVPVHFHVAEGDVMLNAVLFTLNDEDGLCTDVQRIDCRGGTPP